MFRLILATLAALYALMAWLGTPDLNPRLADAQPADNAVRPPADGPSALSRIAAGMAPAAVVNQAPAEITTVQPVVKVAEAEAPKVRRFPGPPLEPSPEFAGERGQTAAPAVASPSDGENRLTVAGNRVNLRAGPGTEHASVGTLNRGTIVYAVSSTTGAWIEIRDDAGQQGFVSATLLSPVEPG